MKSDSKNPGSDDPGNPTPRETENDTQARDNERDHDLIVRGRTVIDRGRRGAKHDIIVRGRTVIDRRVEE